MFFQNDFQLISSGLHGVISHRIELHGTLTVEAAGSSETVGYIVPDYMTSHPRR
jgi:hypothetical protein